MKYRIVCSQLLCLVVYTASAQGPQLATVTPPSPASQAFQKYGDIPVSAYTGVPNISVPIYTIKSHDITVPISLSYHASGIKVSEDATNVGLGWVLNAGGTLSRNVVGLDDWQGANYFNGTGGNTILDFAGFIGPTQAISTGCNLQMFNKAPNAQQTIWNYNIDTFEQAAPVFDFQPDQYYYNFAGHSGKFELLRNKQAVIQNLEKIKIYPIASDGSTWEAKTADGFTYDFMLNEYYHDNANHFSTWYLTKITSPLGNTVTFVYTANSSYVTSVGGYSETRDDYDNADNDPSLVVTNTGWQKGYNPGKWYYSQELTEIDFTNGKVVFSYSNLRQDLPNADQLDSIRVYRTGQTSPDKTIAFNYSYFNGNVDASFNLNGSPTPQQSLRLRLDSVTEKGYFGGQYIKNPPYSFTYNQSELPAKTSFARDHWGYFNGKLGHTSLIPTFLPLNNGSNVFMAQLGLMGVERDADPNYSSAFILTQIKYPTGGYTTFDYESNDFDVAKSEINDFTWFAEQQTVAYAIEQQTQTGYDIQLGHYLGVGQTLDLTTEFKNKDGSYPQVTLTSAFRLSGGTGANCNDIFLPANVVYFELRGPSGNLIDHVDPGALRTCGTGVTGACAGCQTGSPVFSYTMTYALPPAVYTWTAYVQPGNTYMAKLQDIHATYEWYTTSSSPTINNFGQGGGLRIMRITDHDGMNEANNKIRHYLYDRYGPNASGQQVEYSYGRRMSNPQYSYFTNSWDIGSVQTGSGCVATNYFTAHLMRSSDSDVPLNGSAAGAVVGYDTVTELEGNNGEYGQKVFTYINVPDAVSSFTDQYTGFGLPEMPPYGSNGTTMTNGSLLTETDYVNRNGNMVMVKQVNNQYSTLSSFLSNGNLIYGLSDRALPVYLHGDMCAGGGTTLCNTNEVMTYLSMQSAWNVLSQSTELTFDQNNPSLNSSSTTQYFYENPNHLQLTKTVTTNSKGELITSHTQYPLDFTNTTGTDAFSKGVAYLQNNFFISTPVEKYVQRSNSDGSNLRTTNAVLTTFNATKPTPSVVQETEVTSPITSFTPASTSASGSTYNSAYQPLLSFDSYDADGNLLQQHKVGNMNTSYIWDYNIGLPICEVKNAAQGDIAYTSFEADGFGNWTVTGGGTNTGGITGAMSRSMNSTTISKTGLNSSNTYIVSYWTTNGTPYSIAGTVAGYPIQGKRISGWSYFEHKITGQTGVSITGSGNIDELRLYPASAQMRTITYTPLIGVTSECDAGNKITYYYYDALGRLKYVKDQDGNIVKTIQYHLIGQAGN